MILKKMLPQNDLNQDASFDDFGACCWILMILKNHAGF